MGLGVIEEIQSWEFELKFALKSTVRNISLEGNLPSKAGPGTRMNEQAAKQVAQFTLPVT